MRANYRPSGGRGVKKQMEGISEEQTEKKGVSAEICKDQKNVIAARSIFSQTGAEDWKEQPIWSQTIIN